MKSLEKIAQFRNFATATLFLCVMMISYCFKTILYSTCLFFYCSCMAQKNKPVYVSYLVEKQSFSGVAVYETGLDGVEKKSAPDTTYSVYLKTLSKSKSIIDSIFVNDISCQFVAVQMTPSLHCLGNQKSNAKSFCLEQSKGFTWLQIDLSKTEGVQLFPKLNNIQVYGRSDKKTFSITVSKVIQLEPGIMM